MPGMKHDADYLMHVIDHLVIDLDTADRLCDIADVSGIDESEVLVMLVNEYRERMVR